MKKRYLHPDTSGQGLMKFFLDNRAQKAQLLREGYSGRTESEITESRGFFKVYDCSNYVFTLV